MKHITDCPFATDARHNSSNCSDCQRTGQRAPLRLSLQDEGALERVVSLNDRGVPSLHLQVAEGRHLSAPSKLDRWS